MKTTKTLTARVSGAALLALAALPMVALATGANAATVKVSDLNLTTEAGVAAYQARANVAANKYCADSFTIGERMACRSGVKAELTEKMDELRQIQLAKQSPNFAAR